MKNRVQKKATTLKPSKKIQFSSIILAEFACTGCLISKYIPTMLLTEVPEPVYPADLDNIEKLILKNVKFETKHTAPVFSSPTHEHPEGYSHCGYFRLARLWKPWENPARYQEPKIYASLDLKVAPLYKAEGKHGKKSSVS